MASLELSLDGRGDRVRPMCALRGQAIQSDLLVLARLWDPWGDPESAPLVLRNEPCALSEEPVSGEPR